MQGNANMFSQYPSSKPQHSMHGLNWQQQLQQASTAFQLPYGTLGSSHGVNMPSSSLQRGSNQGDSIQGGSLQGVSHQGGSNQGVSIGSISSPSAAAAADSWSWLDAFEQKQQSERSSGETLFSRPAWQTCMPTQHVEHNLQCHATSSP